MELGREAFPKVMVDKVVDDWAPGKDCVIVNMSMLYKILFDSNGDVASGYNSRFNGNDADWLAAWYETQGGNSGKGNGGRKRPGSDTGRTNERSSNTKGAWSADNGWGKSSGYGTGWNNYNTGGGSTGSAASGGPGRGGTSSASGAAPPAPPAAPASSAAPEIVNWG